MVIKWNNQNSKNSITMAVRKAVQAVQSWDHTVLLKWMAKMLSETRGEFCPNVSIALPPPKFEGGEGVITKRCFVLLSDDGRRLKWWSIGHRAAIATHSLPPSLGPRSKNAIQNLGNSSADENQEDALKSNFHCRKFLEGHRISASQIILTRLTPNNRKRSQRLLQICR